MHSLGVVQESTSLSKVLQFELELTEATILKCINTYMHAHKHTHTDTHKYKNQKTTC